MITIHTIMFPQQGTQAESRIVYVEVIERRNDTLRLRINQVETTARTNQHVPKEFLALAEVVPNQNGYTVKLTPLEWLKEDPRLSLHQEQTLLTRVTDQLILWGFSSLENALPWAYAMAKLGIPLQKRLFEQVIRLSHRYDEGTMKWFLQAIRHGFTPDDEVMDMLRHLSSWLAYSLSEGDDPTSPEALSKNSQTPPSLPEWVVSLFGETPWLEKLAFAWKWKDSVILFHREQEKNHLSLLLDDKEVGRWHIFLEWTETLLMVNITMDPWLWTQHHNYFQAWAEESQNRWESYQRRKVTVHLHPWKNPWEFFLVPEDVSPPRGINLYA